MRPFEEGKSMADLDGKPARSLKIECPRPMKPSRRRHIEPVILQALIDLVYLLFARLHEANMKAGGILDFGRLTCRHQYKRQPFVVEQPGHLVVAFTHAPQPEILFQELMGLR